MSTRIYVACLASYNNGRLYGRWIEASTEIEDMQAEITEMLRGSPYPNVMVRCPVCKGTTANDETTYCEACKGKGEVPSAEEWAIHDYEGLGDNLGEYAGLEEVARRVAIAEAAEGNSIPVSVIIDAMADRGADDADDFISDAYRGCFDSWQDMAEQWLDETGELNAIPEHLRNYFDHAAYARDMELCGDFSGYHADGNLYVFWNH